MNATVKSAAAQQRHVVKLPTFSFEFIKQRFLVSFLVFMLFVSALAVILTTSWNRQAVTNQHELVAVQQQLHNQWGQLVSEQGAMTSQTSVANVARQKLNMQTPDSKKVVMVKE